MWCDIHFFAKEKSTWPSCPVIYNDVCVLESDVWENTRENMCRIILLGRENPFVHSDGRPARTSYCSLLTEAPLYKLTVSKFQPAPGATTFVLASKPSSEWLIHEPQTSAGYGQEPWLPSRMQSQPLHLCLPKDPPGINPSHSPFLFTSAISRRSRLLDHVSLLQYSVDSTVSRLSLSSLCNHSLFHWKSPPGTHICNQRNLLNPQTYPAITLTCLSLEDTISPMAPSNSDSFSFLPLCPEVTAVLCVPHGHFQTSFPIFPTPAKSFKAHAFCQFHGLSLHVAASYSPQGTSPSVLKDHSFWLTVNLSSHVIITETILPFMWVLRPLTSLTTYS